MYRLKLKLTENSSFYLSRIGPGGEKKIVRSTSRLAMLESAVALGYRIMENDPLVLRKDGVSYNAEFEGFGGHTITAMEVNELNRGDYFMFVSPLNEANVYEFVRSENSDNCEIKEVAFKMDGIWHPRSGHLVQNCNPYADVKRVAFAVVDRS